MLNTNKITYAAASAAASVALWGCARNEDSHGHHQASHDMSEGEREVHHMLHRCFSRNVCDKDGKPDYELIAKGMAATANYCAEHDGGLKAVEYRLENWRVGDEIPTCAKRAINSICRHDQFPGHPWAHLAHHWDHEHQERVEKHLTHPAILAVQEHLKKALEKANLPCDEKAVADQFDNIVKFVKYEHGQGHFKDLARRWSCARGDALPHDIKKAVEHHIDEMLKEEHHEEHHEKHHEKEHHEEKEEHHENM